MVQLWYLITGGLNKLTAVVVLVWVAFKALLKVIWDYCKTGWTWLVGLIWILVVAIIDVINTINDMVTTLLAKLAAIVVPSPTVLTSVSDWFNVINTFFPLVEMFVILAGLSTLWIIALYYRFTKSWLPTVN
jgi:hypothetical protein